MADDLSKDMKGGDVLLADRAYFDFAFLHNLTAREVFWDLRQKANIRYEVVESRKASGDVISDEIVRLTAANTSGKYPQTFRCVPRDRQGQRREAGDDPPDEQHEVEGEYGVRTLEGEMGDQGVLQGTQADAPADGLYRDERESGQEADMDGAAHPHPASLPQVPLRVEQGFLAPRRDLALGGVDGPGHCGDPAPLWDGITPAPTTTALHSTAFGGLLDART